MQPKRRKRRQQYSTKSNAYLDVKQEYLDTGNPPLSSPLPLPPGDDTSSSSDEAGMSEVRLRASEKRDILLYYILENFYTIDEAHKSSLYAFMLKLSESKAIDFDPFVQPGLYSHFRKQLDNVMLDIRSKVSVQPLLQGIHSTNYNNNMVSRAAIDFESVCFLGKGGFGEVIKARNRIDGMMYALKKVRFRDLPNSAKNLEKVLREVKALAQLDHENVLRYYNAWIEVEHAGEYTKKMLEAVSHMPQLPAPSPSSPPSPSLSPPRSFPPSFPVPYLHPRPSQPTLSVEVSSEFLESEEEEEEVESSGDGMPRVGAVYGCATSSTEEEVEEERGEEDESDSEEESNEGGVEFEELDSSQSSSRGMLHGINTMKMDGKMKKSNGSERWSNNSSSDTYNMHGINTTKITEITKSIDTAGGLEVIIKSRESDESITINNSESNKSKTRSESGSSSSSHSNTHGINLPARKGGRGRVRRGAHMLTDLARLAIRPSKKDDSKNSSNTNSHTPPTVLPPPSTLRLSSELAYAWSRSKSGERVGNGTGEVGTGETGGTRELSANSRTGPIVADYNRDSSREEWETGGGTSASKNFSNEVSPNNIDPKQLLVVPFTGGAPRSPPPPPPKNRYVLYIQMQLCESKTLKSFLERPDRHVSSIVENMAIFQQIVSGLHHIHSRGLIHRDLKPDNIFFTSTGTIKIGDFGLSKQFCEKVVEERKPFDEESSPHTMGIGTKSYARTNQKILILTCSPEQIRSNFYTIKSDIYSLGIILFELFNVFSTYTERAKVLQDLRQGVIPTSMWSRFPDVARFVLCLMDDVPENRPTTDDILRSTFMSLSQGPCSVTSMVVQQRGEIERLQERIMRLEQELKVPPPLPPPLPPLPPPPPTPS